VVPAQAGEPLLDAVKKVLELVRAPKLVVSRSKVVRCLCIVVCLSVVSKAILLRIHRLLTLKKLNLLTVTEVDVNVMFDLGLISDVSKPVKVLGYGTIDKAVQLKVNAISEKAKAAVEAAGGKVEIV
jgi:ribosomal protein L15